MEPTTLMIFGDLSQRTDCHIETIRYYERVDLLPRAQRHGRYRAYSKADVARLSFVMRSRELDLPRFGGRFSKSFSLG